MKLKLYKQLLFILLFFYFFSSLNAYSSNITNMHSKEFISNYFSGLLSAKKHNSSESLNFFLKTKELRKIHFPFVKEYLSVLVQERKIREAIKFLNNADKESNNFTESNIILGTFNLLNKKYDKASYYFNLINKNSQSSGFEKLMANTLIDYNNVFNYKNYKENKDKIFFKKIPSNYKNFTIINETLVNCFLEKNIDESFLKLTNSSTIDYRRYVYFYINYLLLNNREKEAVNIIDKHTDIIKPNLLLDQTNQWMLENRHNEITFMFSCKNPKHLLGEFFYVISNLYAGEQYYKKSNFYLNLSLYFNPKFISNNMLLAENFMHIGNFKESKKIYKLFKKKNNIFHWHSVKKITLIDLDIENEDENKSLNYLIKNFNSLKNPNIKILFDMANFYRSSNKFKESIDYYSKVINVLDKRNPYYADILFRRGASYERIGMWRKSDADLMESLEINFEEPNVLNYLAYSWLERDYKIKESMEMLLSAHKKKPKDPYIIDSVGWAYYLQGNNIEAEKFIREAIKLLPSDPVINDHYGDILWKLNKHLQAKYFWNQVLNLKAADSKIKKKIKKKLIFGVKDFS